MSEDKTPKRGTYPEATTTAFTFSQCLRRSNNGTYSMGETDIGILNSSVLNIKHEKLMDTAVI